VETASVLRQVPAFEQLLVNDGTSLKEDWLMVDQALQEERTVEGCADPLMRRNLSPTNLQTRGKYADYGSACDTMLVATHTEFAPWRLVNRNHHRRGRLALVRHLLGGIPERKVPETLVDIPPFGVFSVGREAEEALHADLIRHFAPACRSSAATATLALRQETAPRH